MVNAKDRDARDCGARRRPVPFGHRLSDHPIVHPGKEDTAHSHDCFGNTSTKFHATYESVIAAPTT